MNVFVIATTLQAGGGITIYKQFLNHLPKHIGEDKYYVFVNEKLPKDKIEGVKYILMPILSKLKRILFEGNALKSESYKLGVKPDVVISLQNNGYKSYKDCRQVVYYHQSLPLYPGSYNPFKHSERYLFNYKYLFPRLVKRTWVQNTLFVVQTPVVKKRFASYFGYSEENVHVCFPDIEKIDTAQGKTHDWGDKCFHFLYVSSCAKYQNGIILIKAVELLYKKNPDLARKIRIHITINPDRAPAMCNLVQKHRVGDNFIFEGVIKHDVLLNYYKSISALLFPSSIETVGLPMLEAAAFGIPIIAADIDYAHYVLDGYLGVEYKNVGDFGAWAEAIEAACGNKATYQPFVGKRLNGWLSFFKLIQK